MSEAWSVGRKRDRRDRVNVGIGGKIRHPRETEGGFRKRDSPDRNVGPSAPAERVMTGNGNLSSLIQSANSARLLPSIKRTGRILVGGVWGSKITGATGLRCLGELPWLTLASDLNAKPRRPQSVAKEKEVSARDRRIQSDLEFRRASPLRALLGDPGVFALNALHRLA